MKLIAWLKGLFVKKEKFRQPLRGETLLDKYGLIMTIPQGVLVFYQLAHKTDRDEAPYSWALIEHSVDNSCAFLWMIFTPEKMRRKGYAVDLLHLLGERYAEIRTHYTDDIINSAGTQLCLKAGFKPNRSIKKREPHFLVWTRPKTKGGK